MLFLVEESKIRRLAAAPLQWIAPHQIDTVTNPVDCSSFVFEMIIEVLRSLVGSYEVWL